jgi:hypothetical protein
MNYIVQCHVYSMSTPPCGMFQYSRKLCCVITWYEILPYSELKCYGIEVTTLDGQVTGFQCIATIINVVCIFMHVF